MICRLCVNNLNENNYLKLFNCDDDKDENKTELYLTKAIAKYLHLELTPEDVVSTSICLECWKHLDDFKKFCEYIEEKQRNLQNEFFSVSCKAELGNDDTLCTEYTIDKNNLESLLDIKDVTSNWGASDGFDGIGDVHSSENAEKEFAYAKDDEYYLVNKGDDDAIDVTNEKNDNSKASSEEAKVKRRRKRVSKILIKKSKIPPKRLKRLSSSSSTATAVVSSKNKNANNKNITENIQTSRKRYTRSSVALKKDDDEPILNNIENVIVEEENKNMYDNDVDAAVDNVIPSLKKETKSSFPKKDNRSFGEQKKDSDALIANNMRLKCEICEVPLETFSKLKAHFRTVHNCAGYIHCCGKRFTKRIILVDHINLHLNPLYFQCKICQKVSKSRNCLHVHMTSAHAKPEDMKYECTICGKKFASPYSFKNHAFVHDTERKFACELCGKGFPTQYRLSSHTKAIHENIRPHVCDFCGRTFKFKPSFDQHVAEHQGIREPPAQCSICSDWFKHKMGLSKHIRRHHTEKKEDTVIDVNCDACGRLFHSKAALGVHRRYEHGTKKLQCHFCEKTFKKKCALEEHIAMHTGEKHHKCAYCQREFRSKANMYAHVKRDHFDEWSKTKIAKRMFNEQTPVITA